MRTQMISSQLMVQIILRYTRRTFHQVAVSKIAFDKGNQSQNHQVVKTLTMILNLSRSLKHSGL